MKRIKTLIVALAAVSACGCVNLDPAPDLTRHFTLSPAGSGGPAPARTDIAIVIQEVGVPDYLKRSNLVARKNSDEISISEEARWAEPLEVGVARVTAENLTAALPGSKIRVSNQPGAREGETQLYIMVSEFAVLAGTEAVLEAQTKLYSADNRKLLFSMNGRHARAVEAGADVARAEVAAMSAALEDYSAAVAARIQSLGR